MCDRKSLTSRAASAVGALQLSHFPGGDEMLLLEANRDVVDCARPAVCQDVVVVSELGSVEEESLFERVKKKLRQAAMLAGGGGGGSPAKHNNTLDRRSLSSSSSHVSKTKKKPTKKTRHSWHQEIL